MGDSQSGVGFGWGSWVEEQSLTLVVIGLARARLARDNWTAAAAGYDWYG